MVGRRGSFGGMRESCVTWLLREWVCHICIGFLRGGERDGKVRGKRLLGLIRRRRSTARSNAGHANSQTCGRTLGAMDIYADLPWLCLRLPLIPGSWRHNFSLRWTFREGINLVEEVEGRKRIGNCESWFVALSVLNGRETASLRQLTFEGRTVCCRNLLPAPQKATRHYWTSIVDHLSFEQWRWSHDLFHCIHQFLHWPIQWPVSSISRVFDE